MKLRATSQHERSAHLPAEHRTARARLRLAFILTVGILLVEVVGGALSHSLALYSDAGHVLTDVVALGLAWFAAAQAARPATARRTFGYHRVGILAALANGVTLILIAAIIGYEAYQRFTQPQQVTPGIMLAAAAVGMAVNIYIAANLHGHDHGNLNVRAAALHVIGDIGASLGVIVGAVAILLTGATWVDPLVSALIAALIAVGAVRLLREAISILLEFAPHGLSVAELVADMRAVPGVRDIHDLHVWTISSGMRALSCHALIDDIPPSESAHILDQLTEMLRTKYSILHTTIQFESAEHSGHDGFCACPPESGALYCELRPLDADHPGHEHADAPEPEADGTRLRHR